jgi:hypothetical protein
MNAFNGFMRDLDNMVNTATGKPPAPDYPTDITDAHLLLVEQPESFSWSAPVDQLHAVRERWQTLGIQVATVTV